MLSNTKVLYLMVNIHGVCIHVDIDKSVLNEENVDAIAEKLSRMRGAALKLGQMLSIQGKCGNQTINEKGLYKV
jgi:predicted unusual protein kinase regulating ubiquinone biosynthesis (AarF/ABC1/UbiB family)